MKKNDLRDALSAIDRRYIEESDDLKAVSADFRKAKNRKAENGKRKAKSEKRKSGKRADAL